MPNETTKRRTKDSVFVDLFTNTEYVLQLYKELHPEDTDVTEADINIQTIKSILVNTLYNDLGFTVKNKFVLLIGAQSIWNKNISLRMLFYLSETYRRYLKDTVQSELSEDLVELPKPELYVVYSGDKEISDTISLNDTYFDGSAPIDVKVKVLDKVNDTIYGQYIGFCKIFNEQKKLHGNSVECAKETIRICREKGYLSTYLQTREKEVITMLDELFDEDALREAYIKAKEKKEREEVRKEERADLISKLIKAGFSEEQLNKALNAN